MRKRTIPRKQKVASIENLPVLNPNAAGLDIASDEIMACVPSDRDEHNIQAFGTFTCDLHALADWLKKCRITTVAMESTGLYWIPIFELLEARGFTVILANPLHAKQVAGRKSDVYDAQWIQTLHTFGLLAHLLDPMPISPFCAATCAIAPHLLKHALITFVTCNQPSCR